MWKREGLYILWMHFVVWRGLEPVRESSKMHNNRTMSDRWMLLICAKLIYQIQMCQFVAIDFGRNLFLHQDHFCAWSLGLIAKMMQEWIMPPNQYKNVFYVLMYGWQWNRHNTCLLSWSAFFIICFLICQFFGFWRVVHLPNSFRSVCHEFYLWSLLMS